MTRLAKRGMHWPGVLPTREAEPPSFALKTATHALFFPAVTQKIVADAQRCHSERVTCTHGEFLGNSSTIPRLNQPRATSCASFSQGMMMVSLASCPFMGWRDDKREFVEKRWKNGAKRRKEGAKIEQGGSRNAHDWPSRNRVISPPAHLDVGTLNDFRPLSSLKRGVFRE